MAHRIFIKQTVHILRKHRQFETWCGTLKVGKVSGPSQKHQNRNTGKMINSFWIKQKQQNIHNSNSNKTPPACIVCLVHEHQTSRSIIYRSCFVLGRSRVQVSIRIQAILTHVVFLSPSGSYFRLGHSLFLILSNSLFFNHSFFHSTRKIWGIESAA
jgi:hypothetical protein